MLSTCFVHASAYIRSANHSRAWLFSTELHNDTTRTSFNDATSSGVSTSSVRPSQVIGQHGEVLPEDKAAAHALGLCLKAKHHGAFVRFKQTRLKEKKLGHNSMATKVCSGRDGSSTHNTVQQMTLLHGPIKGLSHRGPLTGH